MRLFCFGLGFTGMTLARRLQAEGWQIAGTCRTLEKAERLRDDGVDAHVFDGTAPMADAAAALAGATHVLDSIPPVRGVGPEAPALHLHGEDIATVRPAWIGYLSTTGVYGDRDGGTVDETAARTPSGPRGARRVAAEDAWLAFGRRTGLAVHLFRLSGIYGPGRSAIDSLRAGRARRIAKPGQVFNRIHVADAAAVVAASIARPDPGAAYNLADDLPAAGEAVIAHAAELIGTPAPPLVPFDTADLSDMARSFYADNKIIDNSKIKNDLGVDLRFPTYVEGLAAQWTAEQPTPTADDEV